MKNKEMISQILQLIFGDDIRYVSYETIMKIAVQVASKAV